MVRPLQFVAPPCGERPVRATLLQNQTVADALLRHREAQAARFADLRPPARQTDNTGVIAGPDGARMDPNHLSCHWEKDSKVDWLY